MNAAFFGFRRKRSNDSANPSEPVADFDASPSPRPDAKLNSDSTTENRSNHRLIVGLGNPGKKYQGTRHNVGFVVVGLLSQKFDCGRPKSQFDGEVAEFHTPTRKITLLCPLTFMNASGKSVRQARDFYKMANDDILVICDDFSLPLGRLRARPKGSAGGQKGLQDILNRLGDDRVPRLRIGIGTPPPQWAIKDYVLSRFARDETDVMDVAGARAVDAALCWATDGIEACMNQYNPNQ